VGHHDIPWKVLQTLTIDDTIIALRQRGIGKRTKSLKISMIR